MKISFAIPLIISFFLILHLTPVSASESKPFQIKKQAELLQVKPKRPVKIRLKRSPDGKYTWDLTGDNVDEIVTADKRLKRLLNAE